MVSLKLDESFMQIPCLVVSEGVAKVYALFDTGAAHTVVPESELSALKLCKTGNVSEFYSVSGDTVVCYEVCVSQFTVYNLDMGKVNIWVTNSNSFQCPLLGRDLITKLDWQYLSKFNELRFDRPAWDNTIVDDSNVEIMTRNILIELNSPMAVQDVLNMMPTHIDLPLDAFKKLVLNILSLSEF